MAKLNQVQEQPKKYSGLAIAGFVLSFFGILAILGIIFSSIGIAQTSKNKKKGRGLAIAGLIISVIVLIATISIMGDFNTSPDYKNGGGLKLVEDNQEEATSSSDNKYINILSHSLEYGDYGNFKVVGVAQNIAGRKLSYAEIDVKFYDKDDVLLNTFLDNINDIGPNEKWSFEVIYPSLDSTRVDHYSIAVGSVW
jgi:hypothetical protein